MLVSYSSHYLISSNHLKRLCFNYYSLTQVIRPYSIEIPESGDESPILHDSTLLDKRNKSRMKDHLRHRMEAHLQIPDIIFDYQITKQYQRKLFTRFGRESGIDPSICWPTRAELKDIIELEQEFHPPLSDMIAKVEEREKRVAESKKRREEKIEYGLSKLDKWIADIEKKQQKKLDEIRAQKEKKERIIEEVRQYFGYRLDPKDPKFQEVIDKKEKEERKLEREAKKKEKFAKEMARLANLAQKNVEKTSSNPSTVIDAERSSSEDLKS